jgi:hypothetical protein
MHIELIITSTYHTLQHSCTCSAYHVSLHPVLIHIERMYASQCMYMHVVCGVNSLDNVVEAAACSKRVTVVVMHAWLVHAVIDGFVHSKMLITDRMPDNISQYISI